MTGALAASTALAPLLDGADRVARVIAVTSRGGYAVLGSRLTSDTPEVIALEAPDGARLPNAIVVAEAPRPGDHMCLHRLRPARWWEPAVVAIDAPDPLPALRGLHRHQPPPVPDELGSGRGSTPEVDDWFGGHLVALRALGDHGRADALWAELEPRLATTTALSASLLRHGARGRASLPVRRFISSVSAVTSTSVAPGGCRVARDVRLRESAREVIALGSTSGRSVLAGLIAALAPEPGPVACASLGHA